MGIWRCWRCSGNSKLKRPVREPDKFFEREKDKEKKRKFKRNAITEAPQPPVVLAVPPATAPAPLRTFDDEALNLMRCQLRNDASAFLLNNILLSVQFFENYEREMQHIKNNPISDREHKINEAMLPHNKHVFFADRIQECVNEHITFQNSRGQLEHLSSPRLFIIYDNVEASEPGDTSDYSAVLDAPFYKLRIEDCKERGYVKLKKVEILESTLTKESEDIQSSRTDSGNSLYTDSERESNEYDEPRSNTKGKAILQKIKNRIDATKQEPIKLNTLQLNSNTVESYGRRRSGPIKQTSLQVEKNSIMNMKKIRRESSILYEDEMEYVGDKRISEESTNSLITSLPTKPRKSILKTSRRLSGPMPGRQYKRNFDFKPVFTQSHIAEDTETSGYISNSSSNKNETSETESDYGYLQSTGVLPDEIWTTIETRAVDWSDEENDFDDTARKISSTRNLYETHQFLSSDGFMRNFFDNFILKLGSILRLPQDSIKSALSQGASVYCDTYKHGVKIGNEVFPALIASWPNTANQWIIRKRKIIQNLRTNFSYQWPTKNMVRKSIGYGCVLVPLGFSPRQGLNADQKLQWKIVFPTAERYLESCLAHAHMRCYLFALTLLKCFLERETSKYGVDATHLKNHLFWQCEDNYAKWPEHRLGETLRIFLRSFYTNLGQRRFPNFFIENCNDFKSIPEQQLSLQQRRLADILEAPVMHVLSAIDKIKYTKKDFYPMLDVHRLYDILTTKNPLRILNPNLPMPAANDSAIYADSSESEQEDETNFWENAKTLDKDYQWMKKQQRLNQRSKSQFYTHKQSASIQQERELKTKIILPERMEAGRRKIVIEFFIPHFIAMARSSEKFEAIGQAIIYLEQARRLSILLREESGGENTAEEYLDVIRDKLVDCQNKLVTQSGYKLPPRRDSFVERSVPKHIHKCRPKCENSSNQKSLRDNSGFSAISFVHEENLTSQNEGDREYSEL